jgi:hypothetical protein
MCVVRVFSAADQFFHRYNIWKQNLEQIQQHNTRTYRSSFVLGRAPSSLCASLALLHSDDQHYRLGLNHFADLTADEFAAAFTGLRGENPMHAHGEKPFAGDADNFGVRTTPAPRRLQSACLPAVIVVLVVAGAGQRGLAHCRRCDSRQEPGAVWLVLVVQFRRRARGTSYRFAFFLTSCPCYDCA